MVSMCNGVVGCHKQAGLKARPKRVNMIHVDLHKVPKGDNESVASEVRITTTFGAGCWGGGNWKGG